MEFDTWGSCLSRLLSADRRQQSDRTITTIDHEECYSHAYSKWLSTTERNTQWIIQFTWRTKSQGINSSCSLDSFFYFFFSTTPFSPAWPLFIYSLWSLSLATFRFIHTHTYIFSLSLRSCGEAKTMSSRLDPRYICLSSPWVRFFSLLLPQIRFGLHRVWRVIGRYLFIFLLEKGSYRYSSPMAIAVVVRVLLLPRLCKYEYIPIYPYPFSSVDLSFLWWWDQQHILFLHLSISIRMHIFYFLLSSIVHSHTPRPRCSSFFLVFFSSSLILSPEVLRSLCLRKRETCRCLFFFLLFSINHHQLCALFKHLFTG